MVVGRGWWVQVVGVGVGFCSLELKYKRFTQGFTPV